MVSVLIGGAEFDIDGLRRNVLDLPECAGRLFVLDPGRDHEALPVPSRVRVRFGVPYGSDLACPFGDQLGPAMHFSDHPVTAKHFADALIGGRELGVGHYAASPGMNGDGGGTIGMCWQSHHRLDR